MSNYAEREEKAYGSPTKQAVLDKFAYMFPADRKVHIQCEEGWLKLVNNCLQELSDADTGRLITITCIKEKFAQLRIYFDIPASQLDLEQQLYEIYHKYSLLCDKTCELCSEPGTRRRASWIRVKCDTCAAGEESLDLWIKNKVAEELVKELNEVDDGSS